MQIRKLQNAIESTPTSYKLSNNAITLSSFIDKFQKDHPDCGTIKPQDFFDYLKENRLRCDPLIETNDKSDAEIFQKISKVSFKLLNEDSKAVMLTDKYKFNGSGSTMLQIAIDSKDTGLVEKLINEKADVNLSSGMFPTPPIMLALKLVFSQPEVIQYKICLQLLLEVNADINKSSSYEGAILNYAIETSHCSMVKNLLYQGASITPNMLDSAKQHAKSFLNFSAKKILRLLKEAQTYPLKPGFQLVKKDIDNSLPARYPEAIVELIASYDIRSYRMHYFKPVKKYLPSGQREEIIFPELTKKILA